MVNNLSNVPVIVIANNDSFAVMPFTKVVFRFTGEIWTPTPIV